VTSKTHEAPGFALIDGNGESIPDGSYTYELRAVPFVAPWVRETLAESRALGDDTLLEVLKSLGEPPSPTPVQSGYFHVHGGSLVSPDGSESEESTQDSDGGGRDKIARRGFNTGGLGPGGTINDQVILDDLIVDGSICAGMDCVNGESFGFDTVRLKENNLRIRFVDTSSTSSFPTNDWQLTANDSSNGGANKFSIDDIDGGRTPFTIEAGAPSNSLYVDDGGRVGFGTSTPVVNLHAVSGNTPTLRLEQDGSNGFTPQTWDVAGNEAGFFVRDATNGSKLPFRIIPGAPSSSIHVGSNGNVGLGKAPSSGGPKLEVDGSVNAKTEICVDDESAPEMLRVLLKLTNNGGPGMSFTNINLANPTWVIGAVRHPIVPATNSFQIALGFNTKLLIDEVGNVTTTGAVNGMSDRHAKEAFENVDPRDVLERVVALPITSWNFKEDDDTIRHLGPMAQDFHAAFGLGMDERHISSVDADGVALAALQGLFEVVQEKSALIDELQSQNADLEKRLAALESRMTSLITTLEPTDAGR